MGVEGHPLSGKKRLRCFTYTVSERAFRVCWVFFFPFSVMPAGESVPQARQDT